MTYVPHTEHERGEMLAAIGLSRLEDLFDAFPSTCASPT